MTDVNLGPLPETVRDTIKRHTITLPVTVVLDNAEVVRVLGEAALRKLGLLGLHSIDVHIQAGADGTAKVMVTLGEPK